VLLIGLMCEVIAAVVIGIAAGIAAGFVINHDIFMSLLSLV
jgi:bifunctional N-acetylglucosamine-1-phosphate-uridyltransferase/glucosamine-1-phosphate-acetyltransferase GlmU-like protein